MLQEQLLAGGALEGLPWPGGRAEPVTQCETRLLQAMCGTKERPRLLATTLDPLKPLCLG